MTSRKSKQESSNRLRAVRKCLKNYKNQQILFYLAVGLAGPGTDAKWLQQLWLEAHQAPSLDARCKAEIRQCDSTTVCASTDFQSGCAETGKSWATKRVCNKSYVFLLSHVICHSCPGTYMRLEIPRASKAWTCADLHWLENMGRNLAMSRKIQSLRNADQIWSSATIQIYQIYLTIIFWPVSSKIALCSIHVCARRFAKRSFHIGDLHLSARHHDCSGRSGGTLVLIDASLGNLFISPC